MTKWLTTIFVLCISVAQWTNSVTHTLNSTFDNNYRLKISNITADMTADMKYSTTTATSMDIMEDQKFEKRIIIENLNARSSPTSNITKSLFRNEFSTSYNNVLANNGLKSQQTAIIFPNSIIGRISTIPTNKFIPEPRAIEKCSMNESFCVKVDNYPKQDILRLLRTSKFMSNAFFTVDTESEIDDLESRISDNLQPVCESIENVIFPEAGMTKDNKWRYIIQGLNEDNNNFKQGIRVEKCSTPGQSSKFSESLPLGYTTTCVQKFAYKKLVAVKDSKEVYFDEFRLPSHCSCMYSVDSDKLTRIFPRIKRTV